MERIFEDKQEKKKALELKLIAAAKKIAALNDFPTFKQNSSYEVNLFSHTPQWRSCVFQAVELVYRYASLLTYDKTAYEILKYENPAATEANMSRSEQLVGSVGEEILKLAIRRFSREELKQGDDYIEKNFIKKLTDDLQGTMKTYANKISAEERNKGISGISEEDRMIAYHYEDFKEKLLVAKGRTVPEDKIMELFLRIYQLFDWEKNLDKARNKLKDILKMYYSTSVADGCIEKDDEEGPVNLMDLMEDTRDQAYEETERINEKNKKRYEKILSVIQDFFEKKQKRQNSDTEYWQALITHYLLEKLQIKKSEPDFQIYYDNLCSYSFIHRDKLKELTQEEKLCPRQEAIKEFKKDKGQVSRNIKEFEEYIKNQNIF